MNHETPTINLVGYVAGFMTALSLFSLVDAGHQPGVSAAAAVSATYLLPLLGLAALLFLVLAIIALSRSLVQGGRRWNSPRIEETLLVIGLATACLFGVLALIGFVLATIAPASFGALALWLSRSWAAIFAICFIGLAYESRPSRRGGFLAVAAAFATIAIFGLFF